MTTDTSGAGLTDTYLRKLRRAARDLPKARRRELIDEIEEHPREAVPAGTGEADTRSALDRLGAPEQIVAEERDRLGIAEATGGAFEWIAVALLLIGGLVIPVLGWLIGVFMLWSSRVWSTRDKLIGTFLIPGGLGAGLYIGGLAAGRGETCTGSQVTASAPLVMHCTGGPSTTTAALDIALLATLFGIPIVTAAYLSWRIRHASPRTA